MNGCDYACKPTPPSAKREWVWLMPLMPVTHSLYSVHQSGVTQIICSSNDYDCRTNIVSLGLSDNHQHDKLWRRKGFSLNPLLYHMSVLLLYSSASAYLLVVDHTLTTNNIGLSTRQFRSFICHNLKPMA